jgi:predicted nuclease of predicted toxin-antitoxin system
MALKYLIDENVNPIYPNQIRLREPDILIKVVGESETPPKSTLDPEILCWCEENNFVLVTNNKITELLCQYIELIIWLIIGIFQEFSFLIQI